MINLHGPIFGNRRLSLDHITVADATPAQLVEFAVATGCSAICPFLHSMAVLPAMPEFNLAHDRAALRQLRGALEDNGIGIDLIYPFTMAGRTAVADFEPLLDAGAELAAPLANVLCYDRDPVRRTEKLIELAELAAGFGIGLAVEFYPPSQVRTLAAALDEIDRSGRTDIGVTLDLLHIMRGADTSANMALIGDRRVCIGQLADGAETLAADKREWEAGLQRLLPGAGAFDIAGFVKMLNPAVPLSVEIPQQSALDAGVPAIERARRAVDATRAAIGL
jgi:sugar phosphate isomerase/epimerase